MLVMAWMDVDEVNNLSESVLADNPGPGLMAKRSTIGWPPTDLI